MGYLELKAEVDTYKAAEAARIVTLNPTRTPEQNLQYIQRAIKRLQVFDVLDAARQEWSEGKLYHEEIMDMGIFLI